MDNNNSGGPVDVAIVATHMMLEACEQGLGSCWIGCFDPAKTSSEFNLPENLLPVMMLTVGYAAEGVEPAPKHFVTKDIAEMVTEL